jgi:hypothetical protein
MSANLNLKKTNKNSQSSVSASDSNTFNSKLQQLDEKEIEKKINEYRLKLNQNLLKLLSEERQKEDERERILAVTNDPAERKKLEQYFGYERAQASNKVVKFNE